MKIENTTCELLATANRLFDLIRDLSGKIIPSGKSSRYKASLPNHDAIYIDLIVKGGSKNPPNSVFIHTSWRDELAVDGVREGDNWYRSRKSAEINASAYSPDEVDRAENFIRQAWGVAGLRSAERGAVSPMTSHTPAIDPLAGTGLVGPPDRVETVISRIIRDTGLTNRVKHMYDCCCQICGHRICLPDGTGYAEGHHIRPLGEPHGGPDALANIICLCPNHHAECDLGARPLSAGELHIVVGHHISKEFIEHHNEKIYKVRLAVDSSASQ